MTLYNPILTRIKPIIIPLLFAITPPSNLIAKPKDAPTLEGAINRCETVVIAKYKGYENPYAELEDINYFTGPIATYEIIGYIKGNPLPREIEVGYCFDDGNSAEKPKNWAFNESLMPEKDSTWILMLEKSPTGELTTYRGSYGRLEATERNIKKIKKKV